MGGIIFIAFLAIVVLGMGLAGWADDKHARRAHRCRAVLRSGERCIYDVHEDGHHRARIKNSSGMWQHDYCWVDPSNGVSRVGFFYRR